MEKPNQKTDSDAQDRGAHQANIRTEKNRRKLWQEYGESVRAVFLFSFIIAALIAAQGVWKNLHAPEFTLAFFAVTAIGLQRWFFPGKSKPISRAWFGVLALSLSWLIILSISGVIGGY